MWAGGKGLLHRELAGFFLELAVTAMLVLEERLADSQVSAELEN